ncbi:MAG: extracellular solute-binding protein [Ruminococcus sp.]|nr:extracellular solute-binding protein [Ruminococcus sp.]
MKNFLIKEKALIASVMALTLTAVSCSEVKQTDIQGENKADSQENSQQTGENKEDIIITLATNSTMRSELKDEIDSFNALDNGYQIVTKIVDMEFYNKEFETAVYNSDEDGLAVDFHITQDVMNTDSIDIIPSYTFANQSKYEILKNMGAFMDLYPFMENDPEVNTSTLNQHILSLNETDGKLCSLPMYYMVTTLIGETRYVGNKENWTVDDFISCWEQMPEGSTVNGVRNSENIYRGILRGNLETFVDYEKVEVNFDCPEFRKILEFCNRFETTGQKGEWDYESPIMVSPRYLDGIMSALLFGENSGTSMDCNPPYTMVGYPSADGQGAFFIDSVGSYSISANSSPEKQKGAWEFIRQFYTEEYQQENVIEKYVDNIDGEEITHFSDEKGFCINNKAFDNIADKIMNGEYYDGKYSIQGVEYTSPLPVKEEVDKMKKYLDSINRWETTLDRQLWNIIDEEIMAYLAGEKSLDDTVYLIQNRASILVSEQS